MFISFIRTISTCWVCFCLVPARFQEGVPDFLCVRVVPGQPVFKLWAVAEAHVQMVPRQGVQLDDHRYCGCTCMFIIIIFSCGDISVIQWISLLKRQNIAAAYIVAILLGLVYSCP